MIVKWIKNSMSVDAFTSFIWLTLCLFPSLSSARYWIDILWFFRLVKCIRSKISNNHACINDHQQDFRHIDITENAWFKTFVVPLTIKMSNQIKMKIRKSQNERIVETNFSLASMEKLKVNRIEIDFYQLRMKSKGFFYLHFFLYDFLMD